MAATTATYIGLRTWRYAPPTTRRSGAATGAGVPKPSTTKRTNAPTSAISAARSTTPPSTRAGAQYARGQQEEQRAAHRCRRSAHSHASPPTHQHTLVGRFRPTQARGRRGGRVQAPLAQPRG